MFRFIHFCYCVVIFNNKVLLGRVLLISLFGIEFIWRSFHVEFEKKVAADHNVVCCDICNKWVHISFNIITRYCYRKLQKDETPWYCKISIRQAMQFHNLTDHQLKAFMFGKLITSPKLILSNNQLLFPNDNTENIPKN